MYYHPNPITPEYVKERLDIIKHMADHNDPPTAHCNESYLLWDFVHAAATGQLGSIENAQSVANEIMKSNDIQFERGWELMR